MEPTTVTAPVRRKPVAKGIVSFGLGIGAIVLSILAMIYSLVPGLASNLDDYSRDSQIVSNVFGVLTMVFIAIDLGMSIPGFLLGKSAMAVHASAPERYTLLGMYKAGKILSMVNIILASISLVVCIIGMMI